MRDREWHAHTTDEIILQEQVSALVMPDTRNDATRNEVKMNYKDEHSTAVHAWTQGECSGYVFTGLERGVLCESAAVNSKASLAMTVSLPHSNMSDAHAALLYCTGPSGEASGRQREIMRVGLD